jgi:hypothetical protein
MSSIGFSSLPSFERVVVRGRPRLGVLGPPLARSPTDVIGQLVTELVVERLHRASGDDLVPFRSVT